MKLKTNPILKISVPLIIAAVLLTWAANLMTASAFYKKYQAISFSSGSTMITGTILTESEPHLPVQNVEVSATDGESALIDNTDAQGTFSLLLENGVSYDLGAHPALDSNLASFRYGTINAAIGSAIEIKLKPGFPISGTVSSHLGGTVDGVSLFGFHLDKNAGLGLPQTKNGGQYGVSLEEGEWVITFIPQPYSNLGPKYIAVDLAPMNPISQDITLDEGFTVTSTVKNQLNEPMENVGIYANDSASNRGFGFASTNTIGVFSGTLPLGTFDMALTVAPFSGYGSVITTGITGVGVVALNFNMPVGHTLYGNIKCASPLANSAILATPVNGSPIVTGSVLNTWTAFTDSNGDYALALQPGTYNIVLDTPVIAGGGTETYNNVEISADTVLNMGSCLLYLPMIATP